MLAILNCRWYNIRVAFIDVFLMAENVDLNAIWEKQIMLCMVWIANSWEMILTGTRHMCWGKLRACQWTEALKGYCWPRQHCLCQQRHIHTLESGTCPKGWFAEHTLVLCRFFLLVDPKDKYPLNHFQINDPIMCFEATNIKNESLTY